MSNSMSEIVKASSLQNNYSKNQIVALANNLVTIVA